MYMLGTSYLALAIIWFGCQQSNWVKTLGTKLLKMSCFDNLVKMVPEICGFLSYRSKLH